MTSLIHDATEYTGSIGAFVSRYITAHHDALDVDMTCPRSCHTNQSNIATT